MDHLILGHLLLFLFRLLLLLRRFEAFPVDLYMLLELADSFVGPLFVGAPRAREDLRVPRGLLLGAGRQLVKAIHRRLDMDNGPVFACQMLAYLLSSLHIELICVIFALGVFLFFLFA